MDHLNSSTSSDTGSPRGKEGREPTADATNFLCRPLDRQAATEDEWESLRESKKRRLEHIDDVEAKKQILVNEGKQFYEQIQKKYSSIDKEEIQKKRENCEQRYDTRIAETLYEEPPYNIKDPKEVHPLAYTIETRVKGYSRVCYWNSMNLEQGIIWGDGNYKARRDKPLLDRILAYSKGLDQAEGGKLKEILDAAEELRMSERQAGAEALERGIETCKLAFIDKDIENVKISLRKIIELAQEKKSREERRAKEGKYDNEAEPFEIDDSGKKVPMQETKAAFNSDMIAYQIGFLMKKTNFQPERFVLRKSHGFDTVHAKSVSILNLFVERNSTEVFEKENDHLFALLAAPTIQKTVRMVAQHFPNVELSEIVLERKNSDTKIYRTTCCFKLKNSKG